MEPYAFAIAKVKEAGEKVLAAREKPFEVSIKGGDPRDILTSIDVEINDFLTKEIEREFPDHSIYSEEANEKKGSSDFEWVIDPIDGTSNFSRGIPHFAVCIGLLEKGVAVAGAVYNPVTRELFSFKKGGGAFLNDKPIRVSSVTELLKAGVLLHAGRKPELWSWGGESYTKLLAAANKTLNFSGSALDICFIAAGRVEAVVYGRLTTMDIAGAVGILIEAGGVAVDASGNPLAYSKESQKFFAANNLQILSELQKLL